MKLRCWIAGAFAAALVVVPVTSEAQYSPAPAIAETVGYSTSPNRPLLYTGMVLFAGSYGSSLIVAATSERDGDKRLYWPLVGPWLDLGNRQCDIRPCGNDSAEKALLIADGITQAAGAFLMVSSIFVAENRRGPIRQTHAFQLAPAKLGRGAFGLSAVGSF
ncbi:MAG: hypothetical protein ABIP39_06805 [Polyangiaceae bacterium]